MIDSIGAKRLIVLGTLLAITVVLAVSSLYIFEPKARTAKMQLDSLRSQIAQLRMDTDIMKTDMTRFESRVSQFQRIQNAGFFNDQSRVLARERFDNMQKESKLLAARYEIKPAKVVDDELAGKAGYGILETPIALTLSAIDDLDIYKFIYMLNEDFPGHVTITDLFIEKKTDVTPDILKEIGLGRPPEMVEAKMSVEWRTMTRKAVLDGSGESAEGGQP